ncbi:MAG: proline racemase family protein [Candidatus Nanopelagicales bacterium]
MRTERVVHVVHCHAEGEVGDVVVGGIQPPPGDSIWAQSRFIAHDGELRDFLLNEPRGGVFRHVNLLVPAFDPRADSGFIIMEPEDTPPMSGSNSLCVAAALLHTGQVPMAEPTTEVVLEAPAGVVTIEAACSNGDVDSLALTNVPSFVERRDERLHVPGLGDVRVDTAFGGDSFVIASADDLGIDIVPENGRRIAEIGRAVCDAANAQWRFEHPTLPEWTHFSFAYLTGPLAQIDGVLTSRNACAIKPGKVDRSPTGTGCSAFLALLHDRGEVAVDQDYRARSIIDSVFECMITETTQVGDRPAVIPRIQGRAWVYGTSQYYLHPRDPWPSGYRVADTWPR